MNEQLLILESAPTKNPIESVTRRVFTVYKRSRRAAALMSGQYCSTATVFELRTGVKILDSQPGTDPEEVRPLNTLYTFH